MSITGCCSRCSVWRCRALLPMCGPGTAYAAWPISSACDIYRDNLLPSAQRVDLGRAACCCAVSGAELASGHAARRGLARRLLSEHSAGRPSLPPYALLGHTRYSDMLLLCMRCAVLCAVLTQRVPRPGSARCSSSPPGPRTSPAEGPAVWLLAPSTGADGVSSHRHLPLRVVTRLFAL